MACEAVGGIGPVKTRESIIMTGLEGIEDTISKISKSACSVLVLGETGTGKEIIARRIHQNSDRQDKPFVAVNIGGVEDNLLSSELFGHAKGAFTGAHLQREGQFTKAGEGTIFLDEIGELAVSSQVKLLRILQDGEYFPIGSDRPRNTQARVIAATNADIPSAVREKRLREDLVHRFSLRIKIPALRERGDEAIRTLAENFVFMFSAGEKALSTDAMAWLCNKEQRWPGNVRQLESVLEMACLLTTNEEISAGDLIEVYHDDHKFLHVEENDEVFRLARQISVEGGIEQFRENLILTVLERLKTPTSFAEETNSDLRVEPDLMFPADQCEFTEERRAAIVLRILEVYPFKNGGRVSSRQSRIDVVKALVETLENRQILLYSTIQDMTGLNQDATYVFLRNLCRRIEGTMEFVFYREESGLRLLPKDRD